MPLAQTKYMSKERKKIADKYKVKYEQKQPHTQTDHYLQRPSSKEWHRDVLSVMENRRGYKRKIRKRKTCNKQKVIKGKRKKERQEEIKTV